MVNHKIDLEIRLRAFVRWFNPLQHLVAPIFLSSRGSETPLHAGAWANVCTCASGYPGSVWDRAGQTHQATGAEFETCRTQWTQIVTEDIWTRDLLQNCSSPPSLSDIPGCFHLCTWSLLFVLIFELHQRICQEVGNYRVRITMWLTAGLWCTWDDFGARGTVTDVNLHGIRGESIISEKVPGRLSVNLSASQIVPGTYNWFI